MVTLYSEPYTKKYVSKCFSLSTLFCIIILVLTIVLPFLLGFATNKFWIKTNTYYEQPDVEFRNEILITVLQDTEVKSFSTINLLNEQTSVDLLVPDLKSSSTDSNNDNLNDEIYISAKFPSIPLDIKNIKIVLGFDYSISDQVKMKMQTGIFLNVNAPAGASKVQVYGDLVLKQTNPLAVTSLERDIYDTSVFTQFENSDYFSAFQDNLLRNETTSFPHDFMVMPFSSAKFTQIEITVKIPPYQKVLYSPNMLEILKFAWIQYFSLLFPIYLILYTLLAFVYRNQILETGVVKQLASKNYIYQK